ncbi:chymotrypsin family serine protease [Halanaerobaculum tunisiense]
MSKIQELINEYKQEIFSLENVVGVGRGYKEVNGQQTDQECIKVLVEKKVASEELDNGHLVPQSLGEQETDVIEVGQVELLANDQVRTTKLRPAQPGVSIGHYKITAGTFGAVVKDNETGEPLILSNNHVLANITDGQDGRAQIGDDILQPGSYDGGEEEQDVIGELARFVPLYDDQGPNCPITLGVNRLLRGFGKLFNLPFEVGSMAIENKVDCAVAEPKSTDVIESEVLGIGDVTEVADPQLDMVVRKSGRTSGLTKSKIKAVSATIKVQLSSSRSALFTDQIITEPFSKPGDSGALVVNEQGQAVGLLFAGSDKSTVCNRINNVLTALEVSL